MQTSSDPRPILDAAILLPEQALGHARQVLELEAQAILGLGARLDAGFLASLALLETCSGRVVVCGVGKSGIVAQKISATFASTGTPSWFLHAAEAIHGDLGRVAGGDLALLLSYSGESEEVVRLLAPLRQLELPVVAMTGHAKSRLGVAADALVCLGEVAEACPLGMAPTSSTTAMMAMGDVLAMCLLRSRGLDRAAFARTHPGGSLGRQLMRVHEVMRQGAACPKVRDSATLRRVIAAMSETPGRPGAAALVAADGRLTGFFTDGDLRRLLERADFCVDVLVAEVMHAKPKYVHPDSLVSEAVQVLKRHRIDQLPVIDGAQQVVGLLDVQDVLSTRSP